MLVLNRAAHFCRIPAKGKEAAKSGEAVVQQLFNTLDQKYKSNKLSITPPDLDLLKRYRWLLNGSQQKTCWLI